MASLVPAPGLHRTDRRLPNDLRELTVVYPGLDRVDGSARFGFGTILFPSSFHFSSTSLGHTNALASVSGPIEVRLAAEHPSRATFEVSVRPLSAVPGTEEKTLAVSIRTALTPSLFLPHHPRTLIQLVAQSLTPTTNPTNRFPPSLIASIINASTAALLNTGSVSMRGVVCAVAVARLHTTSTTPSTACLVLDPSEGELASATASGCFAFLFAHGLGVLGSANAPCAGESVWVSWQADGSFTQDELVRAQELAKGGAERVWQAMKESVTSMGAQPQQYKDGLRARLHSNDNAMEIS